VVRVKGVLRSLRTFSAGVKGVLDDGTGTMTLLLWDQVYEGLSDPGSLAPGAVLKIEGEVREYRSEIEIVPLVPADVMVTGWVQLPKEERAIGQVTADDIGQTLYVAGQITKVIPFSRGVKCALDDGTGTITLLVWQELYDRLEEPVGLAQGAHVSVRGKIDEFAGDLEIVPQIPADLQVTMATPTPFPGPSATATMAPVFATTPKPAATAGPTIGPRPTPTRQPTPTVEMRTIASITGGDMGSTLTIDQAVIVEMDYFSQGVKFTIDDGSDRITLLIWQDVMEEIPARYDLVPMGQVRVTGVIEEYQGDLEIIPWHGAQIEVIVPGQRLPIEERQNQQVTPSDEGRIFVVEGQVTRIENQGWLKMWIDDGTGEIAIFVPTRTVAHLPAGIGPGVRLRVTGEVDIYQGELEIIPLAGADVKVQ
jgi:DNA/RNA endonuclease YhcR with UshA esterase domain